MRRAACLIVAGVLVSVVPWIHGQVGDPKADIQQKLNAQFALSTFTADRSNIVTEGAVLELHKDGLVMYSTASPMPPMNTYKNGKISQGWGGFGRDLAITMATPGGGTSGQYPQRKFMTGEKFWVSGILVRKDGIVFELYSDPYDNIRYYSQLKFPFAKGSVPAPDDALKAISDVLTAQPVDHSADTQQPATAPEQGAPPPAAPADQAMAPIAPPPPPPDEPTAPPKTVSLGQTVDQVVANFGQPDTIVKLAGTKQVYYYKDFKVTFVGGKVRDVQ